MNRKAWIAITGAAMLGAVMCGNAVRAEGTITHDDIAKVTSKQVRFPTITATVVYCVEPDTGIADLLTIVSKSNTSVSCPGNDVFMITRKSAKMIRMTS